MTECTPSVSPYKFEPRRKDSDADDSNASWDTVEEDSDIEYRLVANERSQKEAEEWRVCVCGGNCQRMQTSLECVCCKEIDETKLILQKENIGL